jgi:cold shock CspA family protein
MHIFMILRKISRDFFEKKISAKFYPPNSQGTVAKWLNHKGIGFIRPEDFSEDILVHHSAIKQESDDGFKSLNYGEQILFCGRLTCAEP